MLRITSHAKERAKERIGSELLCSEFFRKALRDAKKGKCKTYPSNDGEGKEVTFWKGWRFVHSGRTLITVVRCEGW